MQCANCGKEIEKHDRYYEAEKNGTIFCSKDCAYETYESYFSEHEVDTTLVRFPKDN
ncbi:hypothetical protein [Virgibacillus necropolis]|uniref:hypothetical protein n=1 Tax=Virgibacillus necropolis TaxID=163877 RepID=UPI00137483C0|nr:hypothetical protein [Virgibacillus necropolis]